MPVTDSKRAAPAGGSARGGRTRRAPGEPMVWFSGMWLTIGLVMIVALLCVIVSNGTAVFWPKRVIELEVKPGSESTMQGASTLAGEVRKRGAQSETHSGEGGIAERQLFVGNRDTYGIAFKYITETDIVEERYPEDIIVAERVEYGDLIGYPVRLESDGEPSVSAEDAEFHEKLEEAIDEANERREEISRIEKKEIGAINRKMDVLRLRVKKAELKGEAPASLQEEVDAQLAELQAAYEELAAEAKELREKQDQSRLVYRLPSGEEKTSSIGTLIGYYHPNQLSLAGRVGHFLTEVWHFLSRTPREANTEGGIFPAIFGTFVMTLLMSLAVAPFGVLAAIYLREYAKQGVFVRSVRIAVNNLAGVPSIVFGVFGLGFFVYFVGGSLDALFYPERLPTPTFGTGGIMWASLTLALMTVPVVIVATEEAISAVPRGIKEASLAAGASRWQTIQRIVMPASVPGIITGMILAMARGAGEVAPLMLVGVVKLAPSLPVDTEYPYVHLERKFMHLGFHIYDLGFQSPDSEAAKPMVFATTLLLIVLVVTLNAAAIVIRERLRRKYATGAF